jgi:hypothetical protein
MVMEPGQDRDRKCRTASIGYNHAMILPHNANPTPDGIFGKDRLRLVIFDRQPIGAVKTAWAEVEKIIPGHPDVLSDHVCGYAFNIHDSFNPLGKNPAGEDQCENWCRYSRGMILNGAELSLGCHMALTSRIRSLRHDALLAKVRYMVVPEMTHQGSIEA